MLGKITLAAGLFAIGTALGSMGASAAPVLPQSQPSAGIDGLAQQVRHRHHHHHHHRFRRYGGGVIIYGGYCGGWRAECAARYGWQTRAYYRCLWRHGC